MAFEGIAIMGKKCATKRYTKKKKKKLCFVRTLKISDVFYEKKPLMAQEIGFNPHYSFYNGAKY